MLISKASKVFHFFSAAAKENVKRVDLLMVKDKREDKILNNQGYVSLFSISSFNNFSSSSTLFSILGKFLAVA